MSAAPAGGQAAPKPYAETAPPEKGFDSEFESEPEKRTPAVSPSGLAADQHLAALLLRQRHIGFDAFAVAGGDSYNFV